MPCDTWRRSKEQTLTQRKEEIKKTVSVLDKLLATKKAKVVVGPQGAVTFDGWPASERNGVTDACAYRRLMVEGSALAKMEIARAEQLSGRSVNKQVIGQGTHSHDGGRTWSGGHKH